MKINKFLFELILFLNLTDITRNLY